MKIFFSTLALLAACANSANAADCKSIADPQARLACFDRPVAQKPHGVKNVVASPEFTAAKAVIERKLKDPMSAQWADLFKVKTKEGEFVCGAVNSKNSYGGYVGSRGFIFDVRFNTATIMLSGASDPDYSGEDAARYCLYCLPDPRSGMSRVLLNF
ncbi:hypothetical protein HAP41_0000013300 [Bradyrhizobium barranii subsp. apii]|uniref:Uncharacterized protein n=1 Tax=Bradyrhizobium barranii subsp. apii TaxID=2819348 RepID=A0A8T5VML4_9BRAD|nr:hypothetical protein [Bradyrhizobium barranii]UPT89850.1 hypothetical protein HAP41_0000013300 [Bradyrhizobium barranii subsp. apii]